MSDCQQNRPCCDDNERTGMPESLDLHLAFTGVSIPGAFGNASVVLRRRCPDAFLFRDSRLPDLEDPEEVPVTSYSASYISDVVSLGGGYTARFAKQDLLLWMILSPERVGDRPDINFTSAVARAFRIHEGTPLAKFSAASGSCNPLVRVESLSAPLADVDVAISASWSTIAGQIVAGGLVDSCDVEWAETLPNGWDLATLIPVSQFGLDIGISYVKDASCVVTGDINAVLALRSNNSVLHGKSIWIDTDASVSAVAAEYDSLYGFAVSYHRPFPGATQYSHSAPLSLLHGNAPYAAIVTHRASQVGSWPAALQGLGMHSRLLAADETLSYPRPFQETAGSTPCSDCETLVVTPTLPFREDRQLSPEEYPVAQHVADVVDCPQKSQSLALALYGPSGAGRHDSNLYQRVSAAGVYNSQEVAQATILSERVAVRWQLTLTPSQTATFRLTIDGQQTGNLSPSLSVSSLQSSLEGLSTVGSGNVLCEGGPLPTDAVQITFRGRLGAPHVAILAATNARVRLLYEEQRFAHFQSEAVDTNRPSNSLDPLTWNELRQVGSSGLFKDMADESHVKYGFLASDLPDYLQFTDGATLQRSDCTRTYPNCPYEFVAATVFGIAYPMGAFTDLFSPWDLMNGATAAVETTGVVSVIPIYEVGLATGNPCRFGTDQEGGRSGLVYLGVPTEEARGAKYLSSGGQTLYSGTGKTIVTPLDGSSPTVVPSVSRSFSTTSDLARFGQIVTACNTGLFNIASYAMSSPPNGTPLGSLTWVDAGTYYTRNTSTTIDGPYSPIYRLYPQPNITCGILSGAPVSIPPPDWVASPGVLPGVLQSLEYVDFQIANSTVTIDPCQQAVRCSVYYWIRYTRRVPRSLSASWENFHRFAVGGVPGPWSSVGSESCSTDTYYQYGFIEPRRADFSANVPTDLCLRPNLGKSRVITLTFVADVVDRDGFSGPCPVVGGALTTDRAFFSNWTNATSTNCRSMPTPSEWAGWLALATNDFGVSAGDVFTDGGLDKSVMLAYASSIGNFDDPSTIATPNLIDFSGASVAVRMEPEPGSHGVIDCPSQLQYTLPDDFPSPWSGEHTLEADAREPQWVEEAVAAPFVRAMLSPIDWTLTLFEADCEAPVESTVVPAVALTASVRREPRRVVARYRLPCSQCHRFLCHETNCLELISCDRSVAEWPFYLEVSPA